MTCVLRKSAGPGNATSSPRAVILLLALLFSDFDPIPRPRILRIQVWAHAPYSEGNPTQPMEQRADMLVFSFFLWTPCRGQTMLVTRPPLPRQDWAPPPPPGPTLRDCVERREREAGLRCCAASCCVGPSDEDPFVDVPLKITFFGGDHGKKPSTWHESRAHSSFEPYQLVGIWAHNSRSF
jgi:hypothetical protein